MSRHIQVEALPARADDIPRLAANMRAADRAEIAASHGHSPEQALASSLEQSTVAWTGWIDGEPVCMFGVAPVSILAGRGSPWMLGTEALEQWPRTFLRRCRACVNTMLAVYPVLENYVDDRNELSKKWLGWLGFKLADDDDRTTNLPAVYVMPGGVKFRYFSRGA